MHKDAILKKIEERTARIAVLGMGYVGLPLSLAFCAREFEVYGCDPDRERIAILNAGRSPFSHVKDGSIADLVSIGKLCPVDMSAHAIPIADIYIVCVPTPLNDRREPHLEMVDNAFAKIADTLQTVARPTLVVLESTVGPGCTRFMAAKHFSGKTNALVAYSPEREDPGNEKFHTRNIPKLVAGLTEEAREVAGALYSSMLNRSVSIVPVQNVEVAELAKLWENAFRQINIAAANQLKEICNALRQDVHAVIDAAATKPFGFMEFRPGAGVGGHCIPIDPIYLEAASRGAGFYPELITAADAINGRQPRKVAEAMLHEIRDAGIDVSRARILVLGVSYKPGTEDTRESPAFSLYDQFLFREDRRPAAMDWADPLVRHFHPDGATETEVDHVPIATRETPFVGYDCAVILCDQGLAYGELLAHTPLVVDACGAMRAFGPCDKFKVVRA